MCAPPQFMCFSFTVLQQFMMVHFKSSCSVTVLQTFYVVFELI